MTLFALLKRFSAVFIFLLVFCLSQTSVASEMIRELKFEGNRRIPNETISSIITSKPGLLLSQDLVQRDIKELYKLGQFKDVQVKSEPMQNGLRLIYAFIETPVIAEVAFSGNRKIKADELREETVVRTYRPLNEREVVESIQKIRKLYATKDYYLAEVDYHLESIGEDETKLVFDISENRGAIVRKIMFIGNKVFSDDELRAVIKTRRKGPFSFLTSSGKYDRAELNFDKERLMFHYLNHGYIKASIVPAKVTISKDKRYIYVTFQVKEGLQYRINSIELTGDILTTKEELLSLLKSKSANVYSQRKLVEDIQLLTERYGDEGYAFANILPQTLTDDESRQLDLQISIDKGSRVTIERINITGNTVTRDKVIRRELKVLEGDRYSERNLNKSKENLMRLGFFEEVNFATPRGSDDNSVILNIHVTEKSTGSFNIQAGFSSVESFTFGVSIRKDNFFGYGVSGQVGAELSKRRQFFNLSATDRYFLDSKWIAGFSVYRSAYLLNDFRRNSLGGSLTLGRQFLDDWSANLGYQIEEVEISSFTLAVPQLFRRNSNGLTSALSLTLAHDIRDNRIVPTKGFYNTGSAQVSGDKLGGDNDFINLSYRSQFYQPVWRGLIFKLFGRIAYVKSLNDSSVPLFQRFYLGGPNSLRGYFPNSISPSLRIPSGVTGKEADFRFGGDKELLFVSEIEYPLAKEAGVSVVAFFDAGNTFAEEQNYSFNNLRMDYGFGLRWNSPMGPLRFEWGIPVNRRSGEDPVVFNFSIGHFF